MKVLVYRTGISEIDMGKRIQDAIGALIPSDNIEICRCMEELIKRLRSPRVDQDITVLHADNREELADLLSIRELLLDIRIILILPDNRPETIAMGHNLFPRFLTYRQKNIEGTILQIAGVLSRMVEKDRNIKAGN